jgi:hypothetical protein
LPYGVHRIRDDALKEHSLTAKMKRNDDDEVLKLINLFDNTQEARMRASQV